ncbi:phage tail protein [Rhizobium sp. CECT 9324]|uniref:phage tail protein n=1 Tax=Rhizobium sp. CECT 9324 TaxID=2845820 RepID=UPI001E49549C|nr:phage tail protein [Rhizobium sp. CECT 9324]CAH0339570.1 hypothetical protein RHI9324_01221 [Rhizobium sp. CECT 9324]
MTSLQPESADIYELVAEESRTERWAALKAAVPAIRTGKRISPAPDVLPFLVFEDGLGMLTPYVSNVYELLDGRGRRWLSVRGTYEAIARGLAFLDLAGTVESAWHGRVWWNSSQIRFAALPANDNPLLDRIEGITRLSLAQRSDLRRGVFDYDVGPLLADGARLDNSLLEHESGTRLRADGTLWSFGRTTEVEHTLTEAEGLAIGNWIELPDEDGLPWIEMTYPWVTADFAWGDSPAIQRRALMAAWFAARTFYLRLKDGAGDVVGYRRCRACHPVSPVLGGPYQIDGQGYQPASGGQQVYIEAMTGFNDADGIQAETAELISGATLAAGIPSGQLWLEPDDMIAGTAFATTAISIPLRKTVRDRFKFLVRF